jgi:hypothetical protein
LGPLGSLPIVFSSSGSPENRTRAQLGYQPGLGNQPSTTACVFTFVSRVPRSRTESLLFPKQVCFHLHLYPMFSSVRTVGFEPTISWTPTRCDNQTSLRSEQVPRGGVEPKPDRDSKSQCQFRWTGQVVCVPFTQVGRTVLEPVSPGLQPGALPSKLPTQ